MSINDAMFKAVAKAVADAGHPDLIWEIDVWGDSAEEACIQRPTRALSPTEAIAMKAAWDAGYLASGVPTCPDPDCRAQHKVRHHHNDNEARRDSTLESLQRELSPRREWDPENGWDLLIDIRARWNSQPKDDEILAAITLARSQGLPITEIAEVLGVHRSWVHRRIAKLRGAGDGS